MAAPILIEEFHVPVRAPAGLSDAVYVRARRTLGSRRFQARLRRALDRAFRQHASLKPLKFQITC